MDFDFFYFEIGNLFLFGYFDLICVHSGLKVWQLDGHKLEDGLFG